MFTEVYRVNIWWEEVSGVINIFYCRALRFPYNTFTE